MSLVLAGLELTGCTTIFKVGSAQVFIVIGLLTFGAGFAMVMIPAIPEVLQAIEEDPQLSKDMDE